MHACMLLLTGQGQEPLVIDAEILQRDPEVRLPCLCVPLLE
jgi:hypothetical protein